MEDGVDAELAKGDRISCSGYGNWRCMPHGFRPVRARIGRAESKEIEVLGAPEVDANRGANNSQS